MTLDANHPKPSPAKIMDQKPSPAERADHRTLWCITIGALFPLVWSFFWAGLAKAYGANFLSDPGAVFLDIAFIIHIPTFIFVVSLCGLSPLYPGGETNFDYQALILCTIASFFMYGFVGWFFAIIINSIIARTNKTPESNLPPNPQESTPTASSSTDQNEDASKT